MAERAHPRRPAAVSSLRKGTGGARSEGLVGRDEARKRDGRGARTMRDGKEGGIGFVEPTCVCSAPCTCTPPFLWQHSIRYICGDDIVVLILTCGNLW